MTQILLIDHTHDTTLIIEKMKLRKDKINTYGEWEAS